MKLLILLTLILTTSCSRKYQTYHTIEKSSFKFGDETEQGLITKKAYPGHKIEKNFCASQLLFFNNAQKETEQKVNDLVRFSCPESDYILNSKITQTWWSVIFYSRACVTLETTCPRTKNPKLN